MIERLAPHLVNQIAAGEVVERPSSVVKELVENSLDADASKIQVSFEQGGMKVLRVEDDGSGILESDLPLAFAPHATSKLRSFSDFATLASFGFRGEALASVSSVAEVEIWSAGKASTRGNRARVSFGAPPEIEAADNRLGTCIEVRNLFRQTPARLKFLKSTRGESQSIQAVVKRMALSHPSVAFSCQDLETGRGFSVPSQSLEERVAWFSGSEEFPDIWRLIQSEDGAWKVKIFALNPRCIGKVRGQVHVYLNGRFIRDSKLEFAVRRGYEGFTEFPREMAAFVFVEGSPELFDVNVHPMKLEVRFQNPEALFSLVARAIKKDLEGLHRMVEDAPGLEMPPIDTPPPPSRLTLIPFESVEARPVYPRTMESAMPFTSTKPLLPEAFENPWIYLDALDNTYLICRRGSDLYLFDQHALHERILYEKLRKTYETGAPLERQRLLFPQTVTLARAEDLLQQEQLLERLGFEIRSWEAQSLQIVSAPSIVKRGYQEILEAVANCGEGANETVMRDVLSTIACHSAVRAHDRLSQAEIEKLLKDFAGGDALGHCPHGRPTYVRFQQRDLEKLFHRVI